jgi:SMODS and SLOG-associating 2TM effector domain 3/SMODS and SLOG-associating 2TM effector domain 1
MSVCANRVPTEEFGQGRIPFRIRIGVTGHVALGATDALKETLRGQLERIHTQLGTAERPIGGGRGLTPVRLAAVSQLAKGGDRVVVEAVFDYARDHGEDVRLEVILPMPAEQYAADQRFDEDEDAHVRKDFDEWLACASWCHEPDTYPPEVAGLDEGERTRATNDSFVQAGRLVIRRCDVLIALWNGEKSGGEGGTADTLLEAAWQRKPCIWVSTRTASVTDNLDLEGSGSLSVAGFYEIVRRTADVEGAPPHPLEWADEEPALMLLRRGLQGLLAQLWGALRGQAKPPGKPPLTEVRESTRRLIRPRRDRDSPLQPLRDAFDRLDQFNRESVPDDFVDGVDVQLGERASAETWIAGAFSRADTLASRHQREFVWRARVISLLVVAAAASLGASVSGWHEPDWVAFVEAFAFAAAAGIFLWLKEGESHPRWVSYRLLAERLRSAFSVAPTGQDFRRVASLDTVFIARASEWLQRSFEEVWDRRPGPTPDAKHVVLAWISGQLDYHQKRRWHHEDWDFLLSTGAFVSFALAIVFALVHAFGDPLHGAALFLTVLLPALSAALGGLLSVGQHRALARRYEQMHTDLEIVKRFVERAGRSWAGPASIEAAKIINDESADWLGAMWFLDVDHL